MSTAPKPVPPPSRRPVVPSEVTGLIVIAILVLIVTLIRYWQSISWNWR